MHGVQNCYLKCARLFDTTSYLVNAGDRHTFEYRACLVGCTRCEDELAMDNSTGERSPSACFRFCKNHDFINNESLQKGVIEMDKACAMGCVIQTCQGVCIGGTPDERETNENRQLFWPNGEPKGCSLKTPGGYSQFSTYVGYNNPLGPGGAVPATAECCAQALAYCEYPPSQIFPGNINYANLQQVMINRCSGAAGSTDPQAICTWFSDPTNCGQINFQA